MKKTLATAAIAAGVAFAIPSAVYAQDSDGASVSAVALGKKDRTSGGGRVKRGGSTTPSYTLRGWMHSDVQQAWDGGFFGQGTTLTVVDDFSSSDVFYGDLGTGGAYATHGGWTSLESGMIAPQAKVNKHDFTNSTSVRLDSGTFNVLNLSYGMIAPAGYGAVGWSAREQSIINYAANGDALVVKAAGNDSGVAVGEATGSGQFDYLNRDLIGKDSAIFVGALSANGSVDRPAGLASYSNIAGDNATVQDQFLVVGVEGSKTRLYGTSFAAPVVAGYGAILGSKFTGASSSVIADRLLGTARTDTVLGYDARLHGKGEASLSRALAPNLIQ